MKTPMKSRPAHLLWIVPISLIVDVAFFLAAAISKCGISGCSGAGFGLSSNPVASMVFIGIAAAVTATLLIAVPWIRFRSARIGVAVIAAVVTWTVLWFAVFGE
jgi:hypothetical protein